MACSSTNHQDYCTNGIHSPQHILTPVHCQCSPKDQGQGWDLAMVPAVLALATVEAKVQV
jgi:hypothetical protein